MSNVENQFQIGFDSERKKEMYLESRLHAVPATMVIWTLTGWLTCYLVAVGCGHVDPLLPLISMCGIRW